MTLSYKAALAIADSCLAWDTNEDGSCDDQWLKYGYDAPGPWSTEKKLPESMMNDACIEGG